MPRLTRKTIGALVAVLVAAAGLIGCTGSSGVQRELTVGFVVDPSWAHIPVAEREGYFTDRGLTVKVVNFSTGVEALQALTAGQVDVTTAAAVPTSAAVIKTPTLRIAADGSRWNGFRLVARKQSGIASLADLDGKRIGTPLGTSGAYFASKVVEGSGTNAELVQVAPPAIVTAATRGDVDAVSIFQPYQAQAIAALGADAVVLEPPGGTIVDHCLFVTTETAARERATDLDVFFEALREAGSDLTEQTDASVAAVADATKLEPALVKDVLSGYDFTVQLQPALAQDLAALGAWAQQNGKIEANVALPDYARFLDDQFVTQ